VNDITKQRSPVSERRRCWRRPIVRRAHWYSEELQPRLSRMSPNQIAQGAAVRRSYAYYIVLPPHAFRTFGTTLTLPP
jgi:hypothetical protein